ncbi:YscO family type III secretion system apparatus protein [Salinicola socius]|uniref:Type III secretion protein n=1 Tax=Salinicola socius TaxID=404433 RepID=A0A1Q8SWK8_9GAMM|nr:YscO family type III secretion system apparatus protein [Salinicola socius]OLO05848.1 hypothetical protein BTW07_02590 [Salinicola socius]
MTSSHQLERLIRLRRQRTRLAEEALAAGQRHCHDLAAQRQRLEASLIEHQRTSTQREQTHFEAGQHQPLDANALAEWQQTLADDAEHRESLIRQRRTQAQTLRAAEQERDGLAADWARRRRAQQALERLGDDRHHARIVDAERLAELEMEEMSPGRGDRR